jgi:N6-adenosine-specific RNA methylase IME4
LLYSHTEGRCFAMGTRFELPTGIQFGTILADPPWSVDDPGYEHTAHKRRRLHYDRMPTAEIMAMPVADICHPDAHLWLWTTNAHLEKAIEVCNAWGFHYNTLVTWRKTKLGLGWWLRSRTEHIIFAARTRKLRSNPGSFSTELKGEYRGHSKKPDTQYPMIEALSPGPRLEIFARDSEPRDGWTQIGSDGVPSDPFGQDAKRKQIAPAPNDGVVRGVGGLEATPGKEVLWLRKEIIHVPATVIEQNARKVKIEIGENGSTIKKSVSIDSLREVGYNG